MTYQAKNNAFSTLAGSLTNVATTLTVQTGHGDRFPVVTAPDYSIVTIEDASGNREIVKVTSRVGAADSMTIVRAQEGTTALSWSAGDSVELRMTAGEMQPLFDHVDETAGAHAASAIANTPSGNLAATNVQAALNELQSDIDTRELSINAATEKTTPVNADTLGVIDSAASNVLKKVTWANIKATLKAYFDTLYTDNAALTTHLGNTTDAHDASAISYLGSTNLSATNVEAALDELDTEKHPLMTSASQAEMQAGSEAALRAMSPLRIAQAISALTPPSSGGLIGFTVYTATGSYLKATNNPSFVIVEVIGGGGSGGYSNTASVGFGGGGAGGFSREKILASSLASSETVTIGAGGTPPGVNNAGNAGGTSSFGAFCSATGGSGGATSGGNGGGGGVGSGGDLNTSGGAGGSPNGAYSGEGGNSFYSGGPRGVTAAVGTAGSFGSGGSGGSGSGGQGGAGGAGLVIVWEYR
jgi:hypothetical protein